MAFFRHDAYEPWHGRFPVCRLLAQSIKMGIAKSLIAGCTRVMSGVDGVSSRRSRNSIACLSSQMAVAKVGGEP